MLNLTATLKGVAFAILAGLGSAVPPDLGIDVSGVHGIVEHGLVGVAVGLLVYVRADKADPVT